MTFVITSLGWSFLLVAISAASTNVSVSKPSTQKQGTIVVPPDEKCRTVVNGNYYAGTNKEMKAILQGIQVQLSEMQEQLREMRSDNRSKTGERKDQRFASLNQHEINEHSSRANLSNFYLIKFNNSETTEMKRY